MMADITNQEIKDLILTKFAELDKKIDLGLAQVGTEIARLEGKINTSESNLEGKIKTSESNLEGKIKTLESNLEGKIGKLEAKVDAIDRRIGNEELVSRGVFIALVTGLLAGLVKFLFFPSSPG